MTRVFLKDQAGKNVVWDGKPTTYGGETLNDSWVSTQLNSWGKPGSSKMVGKVFVVVYADGAIQLNKNLVFQGPALPDYRLEVFPPLGPAGEWKIDTCHADRDYPLKFAKYHSGDDWNYFKGGDSDVGKPFHPIADGQVVFVSDNAGGAWGGLIVVWHPQLGRWSRYGHHKTGTAKVKVGDYVRGGETVLAGIGKGYHDAYWAHLHCDVIKEVPPLSRSGRIWWAFWPNNSLSDFKKYYEDPAVLYKKYNCKTPPIPDRCKPETR